MPKYNADYFVNWGLLDHDLELLLVEWLRETLNLDLMGLEYDDLAQELHEIFDEVALIGAPTKPDVALHHRS